MRFAPEALARLHDQSPGFELRKRAIEGVAAREAEAPGIEVRERQRPVIASAKLAREDHEHTESGVRERLDGVALEHLDGHLCVRLAFAATASLCALTVHNRLRSPDSEA